MGAPLVSIIILNFESRNASKVVLQCFQGALKVRWRPLEIILVDNGSRDESFEEMKRVAASTCPPDVHVKFIGLAANVGFARGNNEGFRNVDPSAKYVVVLNNDLEPNPDSVGLLVEWLEKSPDLAGVQPKVLTWDYEAIDSAGGFIGPWGVDALGRYLPKSAFNKPLYVSHLYGAFSVYRVSALRQSGGLFLPFFFMYGDDYELGIRLWRHGFKLAYVPVGGGRHYVTATGRGRSYVEYWAVRAHTAVLLMYWGFSLVVLMRMLGLALYTASKVRKFSARGLIDGTISGYRLRKREVRPEMRSAVSATPVQRFSIVDWLLSFTRYERVARWRIYRRMMENERLVPSER